MAILTKDRAGALRYLIPDGPVPTSIKWTLYDPDNNALATDQGITVPTSYTVNSATAGTRLDEVEAVTSVTPTGIAVGEVVRLFDTYGRTFDCICYGVKSADKKVRLADCPAALAEIASVYNPAISIPILASYLDDTGDGWRVELTIVQSTGTTRHTMYFSVALYSVNLKISPREFLNQNPHLTKDLEALELRKDWPLLLLEAMDRLEERLRTRDRWYSLVVSDTGMRRCMSAALGVVLAGVTVPEGTDVLAWRNDAEARFNSAVSDMLATSSYDADESGTVDDGEKAPPIQTSYKVL